MLNKALQRTNKKYISIFCILSLIGTLTACSRPTPQVSVSYAPTYSLKGKTFAFKKFPPNQDSFYHITLRNQIESRLEEYGMSLSSINEANYIVVAKPRVGRPIEEDESMPIFGKTGSTVVSSNTYGNVDNYGNYNSTTTYNSLPSYGVVGYNHVREIYYPVYVNFYLYRGKDKYKVQKKLYNELTPVYKSTAAVYAKSVNINTLKQLINAIFNHFPGRPGNMYQ